MIIGTAGHIDHGKTSLVRALTGVDTDRLPEERRRGITIELGFAPLDLGDLGIAGIVDVPGHEAFVRTMVAGATGIDLALLVIAADEGVMPQTREHLAILRLLGTRGGVIALTKCDLVDDEWFELVRADVTTAVADTPLEGAAIVATSAQNGTGLEELRAALVTAARSVPLRDADDLFRMPVDRAFSVRGTGTVVTGTIWSGTIRADAAVMLQPSGRAARVRGVQVHGRDVAQAGPATRAAIALAGIDLADVTRGMWVVDGARWAPTLVMRAEISLLDDASPLRPREWVRLHLGTAEVSARAVGTGGPIQPGEVRAARILLAEPIIARASDRFVLRRPPPASTIGGGVVVDPLPPTRRPRIWPLDDAVPGERLELMLAEGGGYGIDRGSLPIRLGMRGPDVDKLVEGHAGTLVLPRRLYSRAQAAEVKAAVLGAVEEYHRRYPLEEGVPAAELRGRLRASPELVEQTLSELASAGELELRGALIAEREWRPRLTPAQERTKRLLLEEIRSSGSEPPGVPVLSERHQSDVMPILRILEKEGLVVAVEGDRFYSEESVRSLVDRLRVAMVPGREYTPTEMRDVLGVSRKYLIPFLEFCDRERITERRTTGRVLHAP